MLDNSEPLSAIVLRNAQTEDAKAIIEFYNIVGGETDYLSFGEGEYSHTQADLAKSIDEMKGSEGNCMLLMMDGEKIVGIGTIDSSPKARFRHVGILGIVMLQSHAGIGIGHKLMQALIDWCKENDQTKKITLVTREDNERAITLYEKFGFHEEGRFHQDSYDGEKYYDSLSMALLL